jgi:hypothetical protein
LGNIALGLTFRISTLALPMSWKARDIPLISNFAATSTWNMRLPGVWQLRQAMDGSIPAIFESVLSPNMKEQMLTQAADAHAGSECSR